MFSAFLGTVVDAINGKPPSMRVTFKARPQVGERALVRWGGTELDLGVVRGFGTTTKDEIIIINKNGARWLFTEVREYDHQGD